MTNLEALFVVLNYLSLAPIILVLAVIVRQQRLHSRRRKALERALQQPARPVNARPAPVAVPEAHGVADDAPVPPWLRSNYIAPDAYARVGFDYTIRARTAGLPRRVRDQGGFGVIQNRYYRRQGGAFVVNRKIYLN